MVVKWEILVLGDSRMRTDVVRFQFSITVNLSIIITMAKSAYIMPTKYQTLL